jgi:hypothetical protein
MSDCVRYQDIVDALEVLAMSDKREERESGEGREEAPFRASFPGSPSPGQDLHFWRPEPEGPAGREHEDIMLRRVPAVVAHRFRGAAGARGFTHAQYLAALVALHEAMRRRADSGDADVAAELDQLGLGTVSI